MNYKAFQLNAKIVELVEALITDKCISINIERNGWRADLHLAAKKHLTRCCITSFMTDSKGSMFINHLDRDYVGNIESISNQIEKDVLNLCFRESDIIDVFFGSLVSSELNPK